MTRWNARAPELLVASGSTTDISSGLALIETAAHDPQETLHATADSVGWAKARLRAMPTRPGV